MDRCGRRRGRPPVRAGRRERDRARHVDEARGPASHRRRARPRPASPPCAPTPGTRKAGPGTASRSRASSSGAVAPTTRPTRPSVQRSAAQRATCRWTGSPSTMQRLEAPGRWVARAGQDVDEPVPRREERLDGILAEIRRDGDAVGAQMAEQRRRVSLRARRDVAALRVEDARDVAGHVRAGPLERRPAGATRRPRRRRR